MIARFAVRHPVTVAMLFGAAALLGALSLRELPIDLLPDVRAPKIAVQVRSGDRPPEELEDAYARPLEDALGTLPRVRSVRTKTSVGRVLATVEYDWSADLDIALLDVQKQVAPLSTDRDVDSVVVRRFDPAAEPILVLALVDVAPRPDLDALRVLADDRMSRVLERVPGVASVRVAGGREREVRVTVEPHRLQAYQLTTDRLVSLLQQSNAEASGGTVEDRGRVHVIKGIGRFQRLEDVADMPLSVGAGAAAASRHGLLRLSDVADVAWDDAPVRGLVTVGEREGVSLSVFKESGENTVAVADRVRAALEAMAPDLRELEVTVVRDQSTFIRQSLGQVKEAAVVGSLLAVLALAWFLRSAWAVAVVALALPLSVIITFAGLRFFDLSLNVMTLGGLVLGIGTVTDVAIVVLEAIFRRLEAGEEPLLAAEEGTGEVSLAVVASTVTTVIVFVPVIFLRGLAAELFSDLAITVTIAQVASLAVALLVVPAIAARLFRRGAQPRALVVSRRYDALLRGALARRAIVLGLVAVVSAVAVVGGLRLPRELLPASETGEITARLLLPEGTRVDVTAEAARRVSDVVQAALPGVVVASVAELGEAVREETELQEDIPSENRGLLHLRLVPRAERDVTTAEVRALVDRAARGVHGLSLALEPDDVVLGRLADSGPPLSVDVRGASPEDLERAADTVADALRQLPALYAVHSSFADRRAEVRLSLDRVLAAGLGLTPDAIARQLRQRLGAEAATTFRLDDEERAVVLRTRPQSLEDLPLLSLEAPSGERIRLGDVVRVEVVSSPTAVERSLGSRYGVVTAEVSPGVSLGRAAAAVESILPAVPLPPGARAQLAGAEVERRASFRELGFAAVLAVALVYMVMASLFESIVHPFTILFTLPTAGIGIVGALALDGSGFSVPALLGTVMLAGIAVGNGILLVDVTGQLRARGLPRREAIIEAAHQRLRPILMTSLTTILGMLPLAVGFGEGAGLRAPMARAAAGGLLTSTFLTLVVIPVVYDLLDRLRPGRA